MIRVYQDLNSRPFVSETVFNNQFLKGVAGFEPSNFIYYIVNTLRNLKQTPFYPTSDEI